ncbi:DNA mismatch endonuclease Vsr [Methylobacterium segetis]|uniref:very short patch repair endonuclease n=1 Tax=Methylobacterium segetis TaxID=2488750 RepID=UPI00315D4B0C
MSPAERSARMALIRSKDTKPELIVRRLAHRLGFRYRLHRKDLPGRPDLTFPARRKVIYVHGCFWHHHSGCKVAHLPASRRDYWSGKFTRNVERDARNLADVMALGWQPLIVWECETRDPARLERVLTEFLGPRHGQKNKPGASNIPDS